MSEAPETAHAILASWVSNARPWIDAVRNGRLASRAAGTDAAIVDAVSALGVTRVLDVGCGEGWLCRALSAAGMQVVGIDGSPGLVQAARERAGGTFHHCSYDALCADPQIFGRFQAAVCNFALFERDLMPLLTAVHTLLTPGGTLVIQTVHPQSAEHGGSTDGWRRETFAPSGESPFAAMPWYFRTGDTWIADLTRAGFTAIRQTCTRHPQTDEPLSLILRARVSHGSNRAGGHA